MIWETCWCNQHLSIETSHGLIYFPALVFGVCSRRLWSVPYQLYMAEFSHSDVLKLIQTFLCWNWNINISMTGCLLKGWKGEATLRFCSVALSCCRNENRIPLSAPPFSWLPHLYLTQISWADSLLPLPFSYSLIFFFFLHDYFQFPWRRKSGSSTRNTKPWFIYHAACLRWF